MRALLTIFSQLYERLYSINNDNNFDGNLVIMTVVMLILFVLYLCGWMGGLNSNAWNWTSRSYSFRGFTPEISGSIL